jgi:hypothetical protein
MTLPGTLLIPVLATTPPEYDPETEVLISLNPVRGEDGMMRQAWAVGPRIPDGARYRAFYNGLITTDAYQVIKTQTATSPQLMTANLELIANLTDAKLGFANVAALQQSLTDVAVAATNLTVAHWAEIGGLLAANGLADTYQLPGAEMEG